MFNLNFSPTPFFVIMDFYYNDLKIDKDASLVSLSIANHALLSAALDLLIDIKASLDNTEVDLVQEKVNLHLKDKFDEARRILVPAKQ